MGKNRRSPRTDPAVIYRAAECNGLSAMLHKNFRGFGLEGDPDTLPRAAVFTPQCPLNRHDACAQYSDNS